MTPCATIKDELKAYADGELGPRARSTVAQHLDACDSCRRDLAEIERMSAQLRALDVAVPRPELRARILESLPEPAVTPAPRPARRPWWRSAPVWTLAGAAACAFALGVVYLQNPGTQPSPASLALKSSARVAEAPPEMAKGSAAGEPAAKPTAPAAGERGPQPGRPAAATAAAPPPVVLPGVAAPAKSPTTVAANPQATSTKNPQQIAQAPAATSAFHLPSDIPVSRPRLAGPPPSGRTSGKASVLRSEPRSSEPAADHLPAGPAGPPALETVPARTFMDRGRVPAGAVTPGVLAEQPAVNSLRTKPQREDEQQSANSRQAVETLDLAAANPERAAAVVLAEARAEGASAAPPAQAHSLSRAAPDQPLTVTLLVPRDRLPALRARLQTAKLDQESLGSNGMYFGLAGGTQQQDGYVFRRAPAQNPGTPVRAFGGAMGGLGGGTGANNAPAAGSQSVAQNIRNQAPESVSRDNAGSRSKDDKSRRAATSRAAVRAETKVIQQAPQPAAILGQQLQLEKAAPTDLVRLIVRLRPEHPAASRKP